MIYVLTEWYGNGSGERVMVTKVKKDALKFRENTLTFDEAISIYGKGYFRCIDVKCTQIDSYLSKKKLLEGDIFSTEIWY